MKKRNGKDRVRLEAEVKILCVWAALVGICLMVLCTYEIITPYILTGYGILLIFIGIIIIVDSEKRSEDEITQAGNREEETIIEHKE